MTNGAFACVTETLPQIYGKFMTSQNASAILVLA